MNLRNWLSVLASTLILAVPLTGSAEEQSNAQGCSILGSWIGYNELGAAWMSTAIGQRTSSGTYILEYPGFDATLNNTYPQAVRVPPARGTWERTGGNTIAFTVIAFGVDANGQTVYIGKISGRDTLSENCSRLNVSSTLEVFLPTQNPFQDAPLFAVPPVPHYGYRMRVDPPAF